MLGILQVVTGFIGFFLDINWLLYVSGIVYVIDTYIAIRYRGQKSIATSIWAIAISTLVALRKHYPILKGICFGFTIETVAATVLGIILMLIEFVVAKVRGE